MGEHMELQHRLATIINLVIHCPYCQPLSGCILSGLKNKPKNEIRAHLAGLKPEALERIFSYHEHCNYRHKCTCI